MPLLDPLTADERTHFLVVALSEKALRKLAGSLGTPPPGTRVDRMSAWDLAWSLVDFYADDTEVSDAVDRALRREIGPSPLAGAVDAAGGAAAVTDLLLTSRDPARDLAWALLTSAADGGGALAQRCVQTIVAEFDEADERAKEEAAAETPPATTDADPEVAIEGMAREAKRARTERDRARRKIGGMKERLVELEKALAGARQELRIAEAARSELAQERQHLVEEQESLRTRLRAGTAAEATRLAAELETATRRAAAQAEEAEELRRSEAELRARLRALETERTARPAPPAVEDDALPDPGATFSVPIFTAEFYESIRRWDRKVIRNALEKVSRLSEDWRHPSLRAIPLEGLPDCYRIRIASDVRLIYRPLDGGRLEILSLIDREDLQRYIRQAKNRPRG